MSLECRLMGYNCFITNKTYMSVPRDLDFTP